MGSADAYPMDGVDSHLKEVRRMVKGLDNASMIALEGTALTIEQVTAVARRADHVHVELAVQSAKSRVDKCAEWVMESVAKGVDTYAISTGFGAHCNRRTANFSGLQQELIRYLNAGIMGTNPSNVLPVHVTRATMLVRANCLVQGYSGTRWEILDAIVKLINAQVTPKVPLRGSITASGDLMPLAYIAAVLTGRPDSVAFTRDGSVTSAQEALKLAGVEAPFELRPKEGIALVNGTSAGAALGSLVCFDANVLVVFAEVLTAMFCEVIHARSEFVDPLIHKLKRHPGQIEAAAVMNHVLQDSAFMASAARLNQVDNLKKFRQDHYAIRSSPQWLGPQIEVIRHATRSIEREINSVNDNPVIDVARDKALHGANFQGTPIGVAMDNVRIALAAIGKLVFAQFSELVNASFNNGLPSNLSAGADSSLDYGFHCAEIAMAAYMSELAYLANPVTTHVQTAEHHNQAVNSLGLVSARKSEEAAEILKMMLSTYLLGICQAIDLRHLEVALQGAVMKVLSSIGDEFFPAACVESMLLEVEKQYTFSFIDDAMDGSSTLLNKLRQVFLANPTTQGCSVRKFGEFKDRLKPKLEEAIATTRKESLDKPATHIIEKCVSYPLYQFVRHELGTEMLTGGGLEGRAPKQDLDKIYDAFCNGSLMEPLFKCLEGFEQHG
ncbi:phenylalanine ammonia-lyase [Selaginella moellendorffii]|uniref:Phenylalanine ammonia-lyase n=1 Tax=Selaginella moellendorffii TaxID=88036 RepID=D8SUU4_SELML|nr:phenylalanine ammonia-lyase [Selaginella moellendorffii]EFJ11756.1 phenylalanine ammonia-lyase [Selaginella moellendorffii]|eukprot:XP_002987180.1 phenylalanine ammonia-lyase [Selaginella moellendorffii]